MHAKPFELVLPAERTSRLVFASPHSGRSYAAAFLAASVLDERTIRSSEDAFVDILFGAAPRFGAPFLKALAPRAYVDLNRSRDELDPAVIVGARASHANPRISSGLGVIPRVVANGRAIYRGKISRAEAERRLDAVWQPYHDCLEALLARSRADFGETVLIDCHSMPHEAIDAFGLGGGRCPDIVLGDRFGSAAGADIVDRIETAFRAVGFQVARNAPFAGAYSTQHYGRPSRGQHAVQIEIDRALYMDEKAIRTNRQFDEIRTLITQAIAQIARDNSGDLGLAAE